MGPTPRVEWSREQPGSTLGGVSIRIQRHASSHAIIVPNATYVSVGHAVRDRRSGISQTSRLVREVVPALD